MITIRFTIRAAMWKRVERVRNCALSVDPADPDHGESTFSASLVKIQSGTVTADRDPSAALSSCPSASL
jgi:hypothetical protein